MSTRKFKSPHQKVVSNRSVMSSNVDLGSSVGKKQLRLSSDLILEILAIRASLRSAWAARWALMNSSRWPLRLRLIPLELSIRE
jgi:hypothetical protein